MAVMGVVVATGVAPIGSGCPSFITRSIAPTLFVVGDAVVGWP